MTGHETAMAAAFKRAGLSEGERLHAVISELLKEAGGGRAKVREALRSKVLASTELLDALLDCAVAAVAEDMQGKPAHELPGGGYPVFAEKAWEPVPPAQQQNGGAAGSPRGAENGYGSGSRSSPEPSAGRRKGIVAAHKSAASSILDRFRITERNGAMTPIGDVKVDRLDSLIYYTGRRRWVADREHTLLCLIKEDVSKFSQVPAGADIRQLFKEQEIQRKIDLAAQMVRPIEGEKAVVNA